MRAAMGAATPLQSLAFLPFASVPQLHVLVPHAELGCQGGGGSAQRASGLELAGLGPREAQIGSELSFFFPQFSLRVYNIAINSTGEEIPSKNVAYSYQAMS